MLSRITNKPSKEKPATQLKVWNPELPAKLAIVSFAGDKTGSMRFWWDKQDKFLPEVLKGLEEVIGSKASKLVFVNSVIVANEVTSTEFVPLCQAKDPVVPAGGKTPVGEWLKTIVNKIISFFEKQVEPAESHVIEIKVVLSSDFKPMGESPEATKEGIAAFLEAAKKYRMSVILVGPSEKETNMEIAEQLDISENGIQYLDKCDTKSLLKITLSSILLTSRKLS